MNRIVAHSSLTGKIDVPSSKSLAHRYLIQGFLSQEETTIKDITFSDDVNATLEGLKALGANVVKDGTTVKFCKPNKTVDNVIIDAKESGSTLRFLIPIAATLFAHCKFIGAKSLFTRPLSVYEDIFKKQNITYQKGEDYLEIFGKLKSEDEEVVGNISSQFITGLIYLNIVNQSKAAIKIIPPYESKEYVDITLQIAKEFGYEFINQDNVYSLSSISNLTKKEFTVEKDFSQMAFWGAYGALRGNIEILHANFNSLQGDKAIFDILKNQGAYFVKEDDTVKMFQSKLKPITIDLASSIDLGPIAFTLCALTNGTSHIVNIKRLRIKESDRVKAMVNELSKVGVIFKESENDIYITGKEYYEGDYEFDTYNDHRIAMALSIFALCNHGTCLIKGAECVKKSYVDFFDDLIKLGGNSYAQ